ncbi:MAG: hypothetical protein ABIH46_02505 [Chloroflexota bacterium]
MVIYSRAPLRLAFAGGGTDTDVFASLYGGAVVSVTIARYVRVRMEPGVRKYTSYPLAQSDVSFLGKLARRFPPASLELMVDVPPQSGLGASGAIGVAALGALNTMNPDEPMSLKEIADLAHRIEFEELGVPGGRQDQVAAAWGGLNYLEFGNGRVNVTPVEASHDTLLNLENSLVLVFVSPRTTSSGKVMANEIARIRADDAVTIQALKRQKELANEARRWLRRGDLGALGAILEGSWEAKKKQAPLTTSPFIDEVYEAGKKAGALGGKISGAGGGGYFYFLAPDRVGPVGEAMIKLGLKPETVNFQMGGLKVWRS